MAQEEQTMGLFGPTVDQVRQQLDAQNEATMMKQAQMTPDQLNMFYAGRAGQRLGMGVGEGLAQAGVRGFGERPEINDARVMQQVVDDVRREGVDSSDPVAFYRKVSDKLNQAGKTGPAMMLSLKAAETEFLFTKRQAEVRKLTAESIKALREKESDMQRLLREAREAVTEGREDDAKALKDQIDKLNQKDVVKTEEGAGTTMLDGKTVPLVKEVYRDKDGKVVWEGKPYSKGSGVTVNNNAENKPSSFETALGESEGKAAGKMLDAAREAPAKLANLENLLRANEGAVTGSFPQFQTAFVRGLKTLGFSDPKLDRMLNDSDFFTQNANEATLAAIGGSLGAQISDGDRQFVAAIVPQLANSPEARRQMLSWLKAKTQHQVEMGSALSNHIQQWRQQNPRDRKATPTETFVPPPFKFDYQGAKPPEKPGAAVKLRTVSDTQIDAYINANANDPRLKGLSREAIRKFLEGYK
jgi:hypothetical protein